MPKHTPAERRKKPKKAPGFNLLDFVRLMGGQSREAAEAIQKRKRRDKKFQRGL